MTRASLGESIEQIWVAWLNTNLWRQFAKHGLGSKLRRNAMFAKIDTTRRFVTSGVASQRHPVQLEALTTFCIFIGHTKSGGSLIGSLLDAHPNTILADEEDVLNYVSSHFSLRQICHILIKASRRDARKGRITARRIQPYSLHVPGQWQGKYSKLQVIGASKAGPSTQRLGKHPDLIDRLRHTVARGTTTGGRVAKGEVKLIHVIRNPYDPISLMMLRSGRSQQDAIAHYFAYCKTLASIRAQTQASHLLPIRYEDLINEPRITLTNVCGFLNLTTPDDYLDACIHILSPRPQQSRHQVDWNAKDIDLVQQQIGQFDFLDGYTYHA
jgi:hypothetical protein